MSEARVGIELRVENAKETADGMRDVFTKGTDEAFAKIDDLNARLTGTLEESYNKLRAKIVEIKEALDNVESPDELMALHNKLKRAQGSAKQLADAMSQSDIPPKVRQDAAELVGIIDRLRNKTLESGEQFDVMASSVQAAGRDFHAAGARTLRFAQALPNAFRGADQGMQALVRNMTMLMSQTDRYGQSMKALLTSVMFSPWGMAAMTAAVLGLAINFDRVSTNILAALDKIKVAFGATTQEAIDLEEAMADVEKAIADDLIESLGEEEALGLRDAVMGAKALRKELRKVVANTSVVEQASVSGLRRVIATLDEASAVNGTWADNILSATRELQAQKDATEGLWQEVHNLADAYNTAAQEQGAFSDTALSILDTMDKLTRGLSSMSDDAAFDPRDIEIGLMEPGSLERQLAEQRAKNEDHLEKLKDEHELTTKDIELIEELHGRRLERIREEFAEKRRQALIQRREEIASEMVRAQDKIAAAEEKAQQERLKQAENAARLSQDAERIAIDAAFMRMDAFAMQDQSYDARLANIRLETELRKELLHMEIAGLEASLGAGDMSDKESEALRKKIRALYQTADAYDAIKEAQEDALDKEKAREVQDAYVGMASAIGGSLSNLSDVMATEGERGLAKQKELAFAGAVVNAIAASIGAQRSVWESNLPLPVQIPLSAALGAQTLTSLMAQARSIYSGSPTGPGGGGVGGSFAGISAGALAERAAGQQAGMRQEVIDRRREDANREERLIGAITDQRVVLEDDVAMRNEQRVRVQSSKRREGNRFPAG